MQVFIPLRDRDFDVTEVAVPWRLLTDAGHDVVFATEAGGLPPAADQRLLDGVAFGQLGEPKQFYREMIATPQFRRPESWSALDVSTFDGLLLRGGHAPGMRQYLGASPLQRKVAEFWATGRTTTCLPKYLERPAYFATAWRLGRYYRTYPAHVEDEGSRRWTSPR